MAGKIQTETQPDSDILQTSFPHRLGGAYWRSFVNSGEIAIGKNVVSADAAKPDPGASGCTEYGGPENSTAWATRVTGFAHQAQICDVSHGVDSGIYHRGRSVRRNRRRKDLGLLPSASIAAVDKRDGAAPKRIPFN
jgi:hypothetical protein